MKILLKKGAWTELDISDFEDGKNMERFCVTETTVSVRHRMPEDKSDWHWPPFENTLRKERNE